MWILVVYLVLFDTFFSWQGVTAILGGKGMLLPVWILFCEEYKHYIHFWTLTFFLPSDINEATSLLSATSTKVQSKQLFYINTINKLFNLYILAA